MKIQKLPVLAFWRFGQKNKNNIWTKIILIIQSFVEVLKFHV
jgi:hypothetical protein